MELPGEIFLFNLSLLAVTFSVVSTLVMLLRQAMGGKLSGFDVYLVYDYVGHGFILAICAVLPPMIAQFGVSTPVLWAIASGMSGALLLLATVAALRRRKAVTKVGLPFPMMVSFGAQWLAVLLLAANIVLPAIQGVAIFELALTIFLATIMWSFVRRISTLLGDHANEDWDPKRG